MQCPACSGGLIPVEVSNHYGSPIELDTCLECQGFWLDRGETKGLAYKATTKLEGAADLDEVRSAPRSDVRMCPRCGVALREVSGGVLPEGIHVDVCGECRGRWFDRGELLVVKSALEARRKRKIKDEQAKLQDGARREATRRAMQPPRHGLSRLSSGWGDESLSDLRRSMDGDVDYLLSKM